MESITENQYRPDCLEVIAEWIVGFVERQRMDMIDYQLLSYFFISTIRIRRDCNTHIGNYIGSVTPLLYL